MGVATGSSIARSQRRPIAYLLRPVVGILGQHRRRKQTDRGEQDQSAHDLETSPAHPRDAKELRRCPSDNEVTPVPFISTVPSCSTTMPSIRFRSVVFREPFLRPRTRDQLDPWLRNQIIVSRSFTFTFRCEQRI